MMNFLEATNPKGSKDLKTRSPFGMIAQKKQVIVLGFCLFLSLLFLSIGTKSSPLYPFNDWVDANIAFTMGKAMMNGKVLYRDIFDHKGPLYYLIFGIGYLISNTTFLGVFILEVLSFTVFLFFCYKSVSLFLDFQYAVISVPLIAGSVLNLESFTHGGSAEEFSLPLLTISLFFLLNYFKNIFPNALQNKWLLLNGFLAGCVLWIKFSLLGFWIGWITTILLAVILRHKFRMAVVSALMFFFGMLFATIPWLFYFGINNAFHDWIYAYFKFNITNYSQTKTVISSIQFMLISLLYHLWKNPFIVANLLIGFFFFIRNNRFTPIRTFKFGLFLCLSLLFVGVYGAGRGYSYYFLILSPFIIFGFIVLAPLLGNYLNKIFPNISFRRTLILMIGVTFVFTLLVNHNIYFLKIKKEDLVQFRYASIINQTQNASLLNFGTLDVGLYTITGIVPNIKYFQQQNVDYSRCPQIRNAQIRYIRESVVDYVLVIIQTANDYDFNQIPQLNVNYELVQRETQLYERVNYDYLLFVKDQLINNP